MNGTSCDWLRSSASHSCGCGARTWNCEPDLVVLAAPMVPRADRSELSELLRVPLNADGFFLEAHMKLRPVDFASEGLFLCGTAHAPKFLERDDRPGQRRGGPGGLDPGTQDRCPSAARSPGSIRTSAFRA